ncbi:hypothetical protein J4Q44_G00128340 [Coregonus suidteri]|uniref:Uncharacterized protein n=1 Tax=Coregonus suidteri TaxID=861788 RepID=A0AAN8QVH9_9TELE
MSTLEALMIRYQNCYYWNLSYVHIHPSRSPGHANLHINENGEDLLSTGAYVGHISARCCYSCGDGREVWLHHVIHRSLHLHRRDLPHCCQECWRRNVSSAARIGTIAAPYVIYLGSINKYLPYIIMGSMTVASSALNLFLPETFRKELPETVEQMQQCKGLCRQVPRNANILKKGGDTPAILNEVKF